MPGADPPAQDRPEPGEQFLVHGIADEQGVHVRALADVRAPRRRAVEQQRHETRTERAADRVAQGFDRQYGFDAESPGHLETPSCAATREPTPAAEPATDATDPAEATDSTEPEPARVVTADAELLSVAWHSLHHPLKNKVFAKVLVPVRVKLLGPD